ncbi:MAG: radical SAM protein [bacterium]|nr:radical SAM protein [bacterium]
MNLKTIPNPDKIGEYNLFVSHSDKNDLTRLSYQLSKYPFVSKIYLVSDTPVSLEQDGLPIEVISQDEENEKRKVKVPIWVAEKDNLERILKGQYNSIRPVTAEFVTTLNCNFRCVQCSYAEPKKDEDVWLKEDSSRILYQSNFSPKTHMTSEVMQVTLDRLAEGGVQNILFTGGGEPLMNPITVEGMQRARKNGNVVALYTNGMFMNPSAARRILETQPLFVRVSVYGGDEKSAKKYTQTREGQSAYTTVIENIKSFALEKEETHSETRLGLSYLIHPLNVDGIDSFADTILTFPSPVLEQLSFIRFTPAVDYFHGQQHSKEFMEQAFDRVVQGISPRFEGTGIKIKPYYHRLKDLNAKKGYGTCRSNGWFVEVSPSGETFLCCEKHFLPDYKIGDLTSQTLDEIWNSKLREDVIKRVNDTQCADCPTLCKPHELNKRFNQIEELREDGEIARVEQWVKDIIQSGIECGYCPGKLNNFES